MSAASPPDVRFGGSSGNTWATRLADSPNEWIGLTYSGAVHAVGLRMRQNAGPGAVAQVNLIDPEGVVQTVFSGGED